MDIKKPKKTKTSKSMLHKKSQKATKAIKTKTKDYIAGGNKLAQINPKRVTNDTMSKHRQEMLASAKKFKYPLKHSKHRIAIISSMLIVLTLLLFGAFSYTLLYKQQSIGDFAYRISRVLPVPATKVGSSWVSFEKYLFEVRQNAHYLINQENVDFETPEGLEAMKNLKEASLIKVQENEVIRQLAKEHNIIVTDEEVEKQIRLIRETGGIGEDSQTLEDTLRDFYDWSPNDLDRVVKEQLFRQKLPFVLDADSIEAANDAYALIINDEKSFEVVVVEHSEDELTKDKKGEIGVIQRDSTDLPLELIDAAFGLSDGEISGVVQTVSGLHIIKRIETKSDNEIKIAHVFFRWEDPQVFVDNRKKELEIRNFISF